MFSKLNNFFLNIFELEQFFFKQFWKYELLQNLKNIKFECFSNKKENEKRKKLQEQSSYLAHVGHGSRKRSKEIVNGLGPPNSGSRATYA
jgi:hypothetical protein